MRTVELTPRLRSVAELVPRGARFADVGTDHAYLPVWLLQQGRITGAVASDPVSYTHLTLPTNSRV